MGPYMDVRYGATPLSTLRGLSSTAPRIPRNAYVLVLVLGTRHIHCRLGARRDPSNRHTCPPSIPYRFGLEKEGNWALNKKDGRLLYD